MKGFSLQRNATDRFQDAVRGGRAYSTGTGTIGVAKSNYLNLTFTNPAGSGKVAMIENRFFQSNAATSADAPEVFIVAGADTITGTLATNVNLLGGGPASSMEFRYESAATPLTGDTVGGSAFVPLSSVPLEILGIHGLFRIVPPGESFGYYIGGSGGGVNNALRFSVFFSFYEEAYSG